MQNKKIFGLLFILTVLLFLISGCPSPSPKEPTPIVASSSGEPAPIKILSLSRAPKLGETAELVFTNILKFYTTYVYQGQELVSPSVHAWVEFLYANTKGSYSEAKYAVTVPVNEVLVSGNLNWEGNPFSINGTLELRGTIRLPREGIWEITGYIKGEGFDSPIVEVLFKEEIRVAVTEDAAVGIGTKEFRTGPLAYLANLSYGGFGHRVPNEMFDPVILELDISRIPGKGEEATLICRVTSLYDVSDFKVEITFSKRLKDNSIQNIPKDNILVDGNLSRDGDLEKDKPILPSVLSSLLLPTIYARWDGDLEKDNQIVLSALIKLPSKGDWEIYAFGDYPTNDRIGFSDSIRFNVSGDIRSFGWEERSIEYKDVPEPPPTPTPQIPE